VQHDQYHRVLACSTVHLYLTVPFVLSWSLLEAMAAGCCIVASATPPVLEVVVHGISAELVDFFSPEAQARAIEALLDNPQRRKQLAAAARDAAKAYGAEAGIEAWKALLCGNSNQIGLVSSQSQNIVV